MAARAKFAIDDEVVAVLQNATITEDRVVLPPQSLDRALYVKVDKVLKGAGGKWSRKEKAHLFDRDPREILQEAITTGEATNVQTALQAFYTPPSLAARVVEIADLEDASRILEPSCGTGNLVQAIFAQTDEALVQAFDFDEVAIRHTAVRFEFEGATGSFKLAHLDFLTTYPADTGLFDRVIMNPPFTKGAGIAHVTHAFTFLDEGGILVAIMPASVLDRQDKAHREFQQLFADASGVDEDVPAGTFKDAGTNVSTKIVTLYKD